MISFLFTSKETILTGSCGVVPVAVAVMVGVLVRMLVGVAVFVGTPVEVGVPVGTPVAVGVAVGISLGVVGEGSSPVTDTVTLAGLLAWPFTSKAVIDSK
jgi:hypothetical protein